MEARNGFGRCVYVSNVTDALVGNPKTVECNGEEGSQIEQRADAMKLGECAIERPHRPRNLGS